MRQRSIAVNGQFDVETEDTIKEFLIRVGGFTFRSENSSEYHCLLWGYYYQQLKEASQRYSAVLAQVENDMQELAIGSNSIEYSVYHSVKDKTPAELDRLAFIEAARQFSKNDGQVAVCGMSAISPHRLYMAVHNRPAFVVRRLENDDFIVLSDINAAMGLFPQQLIVEKMLELEIARSEYRKKSAGIKDSKANKQRLQDLKSTFNEKKK